jgi:hypothetical protein
MGSSVKAQCNHPAPDAKCSLFMGLVSLASSGTFWYD